MKARWTAVVVIGLALAGALACLPAGALAQGLGVSADGGFQAGFDRYRDLGGFSVGVRLGYGTGGPIHHYLDLRGTSLGIPHDTCSNEPNRPCPSFVWEGGLVTLSYEGRMFRAPRSAAFRPFVGGIIGVARGFDGFGVAAGVSYGVQLLRAGPAVMEIGGTTRWLQMGPAGEHGNGTDYWLTSVQMGLGWNT